MNRRNACASLALLVLAVLSMAAGAGAQDKRSLGGEEFYIVASIDLPKSQILLKEPTEVTRLLKLTGSTDVVDMNGKRINVSDLRAGDTVWVHASGDGQSATAVNIRKGPMTIEELHRLYLDYPEIK